MKKKRVVLTIPPHLIEQPLVYNLIKRHDLMISILRANITPKEQGRLVIEMSGEKRNIDAGLAYLTGLEIEIQPLAQDIKWHEERCIHCTFCVPICPTGALYRDQEGILVAFNKDKCIACELCIKVCPYKVVEIQF